MKKILTLTLLLTTTIPAFAKVIEQGLAVPQQVVRAIWQKDDINAFQLRMYLDRDMGPDNQSFDVLKYGTVVFGGPAAEAMYDKILGPIGNKHPPLEEGKLQIINSGQLECSGIKEKGVEYFNCEIKFAAAEAR